MRERPAATMVPLENNNQPNETNIRSTASLQTGVTAGRARWAAHDDRCRATHTPSLCIAPSEFNLPPSSLLLLLLLPPPPSSSPYSSGPPAGLAGWLPHTARPRDEAAAVMMRSHCCWALRLRE